MDFGNINNLPKTAKQENVRQNELTKKGELCARCGDMLDFEDFVYQCKDCLNVYCEADAELQIDDDYANCTECLSNNIVRVRRENIL